MSTIQQIVRTVGGYLLKHPEVAPYLEEEGFYLTFTRPTAPAAPTPPEVLRRNARRVAGVLRQAPVIMGVLARAGIRITPLGQGAAPGAAADAAELPGLAEAGGDAADAHASAGDAAPAVTGAGSEDAAPGAHEGGAGADLDPDARIAQVWQTLVLAMNRRAPQIGAHMQGTRPLALEGDRLVVGLPANPTALRNLTHPQVEEAIRRFLARWLGRDPITVEYVYTDEGEVLPPGERELVDTLLTTVVDRLGGNKDAGT